MSTIGTVRNQFQLANAETRVPQGIGVSPYPITSLIRYVVNSLFNGFFSYINPDPMQLIPIQGHIALSAKRSRAELKILFLGDIMISKSGNPPTIDSHLVSLLQSVHLIIANVESPVVDSHQTTRRGLSLNFEMNAGFLASIAAHNPTAKWVFSIANNHACDTSRKDDMDVSGLEKTIRTIRSVIPSASIIGADLAGAKSVLSLRVRGGPKIAIIGWTDVMNNDSEHFKKPVIRGSDLTSSKVNRIKQVHDYLIGFAHGNEEQSYYPLKGTRDRWARLMNKFDILVGHGPHVLHPAERIGKSLLFHSIGNLCSPVGKSQTKIGCIPEINLCYNSQGISSVKYKVHFLEQVDETVSLIDIHAPQQTYPGIVSRIQKVWHTL